MTIDFTKPIKTVTGLKVRILATDAKHNVYPIIGLVLHANGVESSETFTLNGKFRQLESSDYDLVNVPEEITRYVNFYDFSTESYTTEALAIRHAGTKALAVAVPVTFTKIEK